MTVFRHFETKMGILQAVLDRHSYIPYFEQLFAQDLSGNLVNDLQQIANAYLAFMEKNKAIFLITTQDRSILSGVMDLISDNQTKQLLKLLEGYFQAQIEQGKMKDIDTNGQATVFLTSLFGFFVSNALWDEHFLKNKRKVLFII